MFENIIGHSDTKKILEEQIKSGNISHSYLFEGIDGIGKKLIAMEFARKILNVQNLNSSPDYKYITKYDDKKDIIVEQVRKQIIDDVYIKPSSGNKKVYLIDDAHLLNTAAQNALLKTLEEPPNYVVIILISSNRSAFLPTIISRVNVISFLGLSNNELSYYIKDKLGISISNHHIEFFDGSLGLAKSVIESDMIKKFELVDKLLNCILEKDFLKANNILHDLDFNSKNIIEYFEYILYKNNYYNGVFIVEKTKQRLKYNGNYDIVVDNMILKIIDNI